MPLALLLVIIDVMLVVHAVRTGRASPWVFIILLVPVVGAIAYVVAVLVPDLTGSQLRRAPAHVRQAQAEWIALAEKVVRP